MRKIFNRVLSMMFVATMILVSTPIRSLAADESQRNVETLKKAILSVSFDMADRTTHEATITLPDGTTATVGAEPIESRALSGTWRIYGYNALATMEYYIDLEPSGSYTKISRAYGLSITGSLTSFENETINIVRRTETSSQSALVEGYAKFHYLGNQWVSIWTQSGGVRASIKNNVVSTELY